MSPVVWRNTPSAAFAAADWVVSGDRTHVWVRTFASGNEATATVDRNGDDTFLLWTLDHRHMPSETDLWQTSEGAWAGVSLIDRGDYQGFDRALCEFAVAATPSPKSFPGRALEILNHVASGSIPAETAAAVTVQARIMGSYRGPLAGHETLVIQLVSDRDHYAGKWLMDTIVRSGILPHS